jgi:hypothetical protein
MCGCLNKWVCEMKPAKTPRQSRNLKPSDHEDSGKGTRVLFESWETSNESIRGLFAADDFISGNGSYDHQHPSPMFGTKAREKMVSRGVLDHSRIKAMIT